MSISDRLKRVRESFGYTQKEMAKAVSVSVQMWQAYEAGKSVPGGNVLAALVRLGINVNWILTGEGEMRREESAEKVCFKDIPNDAIWSSIIEAAIRFSCNIDSDKAHEISMSAYALGLNLPKMRSDIPNIDEIIEILRAKEAIKSLCHNDKFKFSVDDILKLFEVTMKGSNNK